MTSAGTGSDVGMSKAASAGSEYEVFLSFRGADTRTCFTDHLYTRLVDAGIRVYRDDEELPSGEKIGTELLKGINQSKIAIPILSKGYAMSKWCLNELVQIMECKRSGTLKVMPIFYDVSPSEVRKQTGSYEKAFGLHEKRYDDKNIMDWKSALREVGELKGWDRQSDANKQEGKLVREITKTVLRELKKACLFVTEYLTGMDDHVEAILSMIGAERSRRVRVLGIHGMGGIGKTTLAKVIYNHLLPQFQSYSFVADIRETFQTKGIQFLQKKLISNILSKESADLIDTDEGYLTISERLSSRKVLILLDDVDNNLQIQGLVGKGDWVAPGSLIIITTRDKGILNVIQADWPYELWGMHDVHAFQLFSKHAFRNDKPPEDYAELSEKVVKISGGLPLSLEVIGSFLRGKSQEVWEGTLKKLEKLPHKDVSGRLKISFEALDGQQKQVLLDIACFFIGVDHRMAIHFWDGFELYPEEAIEVLQQMSLIKIGANNLLWMHDQMRDFCRYYTGKGHVGEPKKRVLWNQEEARSIFMRQLGAESVEGIFVEFDMQSQSLYTAENFAKLPNLKFLQVKGHVISQDISFGKGLGTIAGLCRLFTRSQPAISELRWLSWHHFPPLYDRNNLSLRNLVFLDLSESSISDDWDSWSQIEMAEKLKVLNLSGCKKLTRTPNFSMHLLLEQIILEGCSSLIVIDSSIGMLKHLIIINLRNCSSLCKLPKELGDVESLGELILDGTKISKFYDYSNLRSGRLSFSDADTTGIPDSIGNLLHLSLLSFQYCEICTLPISVGRLVSLVELNLSRSSVVKLPYSIANMKNLKTLNVDGSPIMELPSSLGMLERLEVISADRCLYLEFIPKLPHSLVSLTIRSEARMKRIPEFSNLTRLKHLVAYFTKVPCDPPELEVLWNIGASTKLIELKVSFPHIHMMHGDLGELSYLEEVILSRCHCLQSIPKLPSSLTMLRVDHCKLLKSLPNLLHLKELRDLHIGCTPIKKLEGLQMLENLRKLVLDDCGIERLPEMSNLNKLKVLDVEGCQDLVEIQGRFSESLQDLRILNCKSLKKIPDIPNMENMKCLFITGCEKLQSISWNVHPDCSDVEENTFTLTWCPRHEDLDYLTRKFQMRYANENVSKLFVSSLFIIFMLLLTFLAQRFPCLELHKVPWVGTFLYLILLCIFI